MRLCSLSIWNYDYAFCHYLSWGGSDYLQLRNPELTSCWQMRTKQKTYMGLQITNTKSLQDLTQSVSSWTSRTETHSTSCTIIICTEKMNVIRWFKYHLVITICCLKTLVCKVFKQPLWALRECVSNQQCEVLESCESFLKRL